MIYFDNISASKVDEEVLSCFYDTTIKYFANPNSFHVLGRDAKKVFDEKTLNIAKMLGVNNDEVIYTSGATEANNLVIKGVLERYKAKGKHIIISPLEHTSITASVNFMQNYGFEVSVVALDSNGLVDLLDLKRLIKDDTILVSITSCDSELGIIQPVDEIAKLLKDYPNVIFHTDATQLFGKSKINIDNIDLITINPHKFGGLDNFGLLIKKKNVGLIPLIHGGIGSSLLRSGTPSLANVVALEKAISKVLANNNIEYITKLNKYMIDKLSKYSNVYFNSNEYSISNIINFSVKGIKNLELVKYLEEHNILVSPKTSCCPVNTPSRIVYAKEKNKSLASSSIRISFSFDNTFEEIDIFIKVFDEWYRGIYG